MKHLLVLGVCFIICVQSFAFTSQGNWRWRNNDGSETSATWKAAQNKPISISSSTAPVRLRVQLLNNTGGVKNINANLQYASAPDGPWRYVTNFVGNNAFRLSNTNTFVTDTTKTTQQITGSSNAFFPGKLLVKTNELDQLLNNSVATEYEYSLQPTSNIQPSTTYYFRVPGNEYSVVLPSLTTTATIATAAKLVTNGSFEDSLKDWTFAVASSATATASLPDTLHKDGKKSVVVNVTKAAGATAVRLTHKALTLTKGRVYMVRFWAFAKKNSAKMQLALKGNKSLTYDYKLYTGWQEYQFAFKAFEPSVTLNFLYQTATQYTIDKVEILDENNEEVDVPMNYMWQNNRPPGEYSWLSADGENSEPLPDGRTVWTFSDGWYGYNDTTTNSMSTNRLLRNTFVTQSAPRPNGALHTIIGGTVAQPLPLMNPPDKRGVDNFFWPRDMIVDNDSLKVLLPEVVQWKSNDPLSDGHREALAVFSLPDLTLRSIKWMPYLDSITTYYIALCKADDGYTYAYAARPVDSYNSHALVARYPTGKLSATQPWQYLTNSGWSYDTANRKEIADVQLFSVTKLGPNNYMSLFLNPLSDKVEVLYAPSPIGPWVGRSIVGQLEGQADRLSYFGLLHEETATNGVYTFSYSNIGDIGQMLDDKTVYWPSYLKGDLKSLSPFNGSVLPVTKLDFTARPDGRQAKLQWTATGVVDNDRFVAERSADGKSGWVKVAEIKSNNLSNESHTAIDATPLQGNNYYRLIQYDVTGKSSASPIRVVDMNAFSATVYPNPAHGTVNVIISSTKNDKVTATLTDMKGSVVHQEVIAVMANGSRYTLHISKQLPAGMYTLQVKGNAVDKKMKVEIQ